MKGISQTLRVSQPATWYSATSTRTNNQVKDEKPEGSVLTRNAPILNPVFTVRLFGAIMSLNPWQSRPTAVGNAIGASPSRLGPSLAQRDPEIRCTKSVGAKVGEPSYVNGHHCYHVQPGGRNQPIPRTAVARGQATGRGSSKPRPPETDRARTPVQRATITGWSCTTRSSAVRWAAPTSAWRGKQEQRAWCGCNWSSTRGRGRAARAALGAALPRIRRHGGTPGRLGADAVLPLLDHRLRRPAARTRQDRAPAGGHRQPGEPASRVWRDRRSRRGDGPGGPAGRSARTSDRHGVARTQRAAGAVA